MNSNEHFNLEYWLRILYRRRKVLLVITLLTFIVGAAITFISAPAYRAEASIYFPAPSRPILPGQIPQSMEPDALELGFALFGQGLQPSMQDYALAILKSRTMSDLVLDKYGERLFPGRFKKRKRVQLREMMRKPIKIMMGSDNVIHITVDSADPGLSMEIANFYTDQFKRISQEAILTAVKNKRLHLDKQSGIVRKKLYKYEKELEAFENSKKVVDLDAETKASIESHNQLLLMSARTDAAENKVKEKLASLRYKLKMQADEFKRIGSYPSIKEQPVIQEMLSELSKKEVELLSTQQFYTEEHPKVKELQKDISDRRGFIQKKIREYMSGVKSNLTPRLIEVEAELLSLRAQSEALKTLIKKMEKEMGRIPNVRLKYNRLKRKVKTAELILTMIEQELEKAKVEEARQDAEVQIMDAAVAPD